MSGNFPTWLLFFIIFQFFWELYLAMVAYASDGGNKWSEPYVKQPAK